MSNITPRDFLERLNEILRKDPEMLEAVQALVSINCGGKPDDLSFLYELHRELLGQSTSQFRQDICALNELGYKRDGFFVEFGAADGVSASNTLLLENHFGWNGILAEPAVGWHEDLHRNRRCSIDTGCVWSSSGEQLAFNETEIREYSAIDASGGASADGADGNTGKTYEVTTISLNDLLEKHGAPRDIDYLSIDTEGSEYDILSHFDFDRYNVRVITCEHNFAPSRDKVFELLSRHGYRRKLEKVSQVDDWYVKA